MVLKILENINIRLKLLCLFRFFHETQWFFEVSEIPKPSGSLNLNFFSNTQNMRFFDSDFFFQIPGTGGYHKNQIPHTGHDVMTRVNFLYKKLEKNHNLN
jgi:hypothetical protein